MDSVIEHNGTNYFTIVDNLFGGNTEHGVEFFEKVIEHYSDESAKPGFTVLMRADQFGKKGFNDEEMHLMKEAGVNRISIGMESVNDEQASMHSARGTHPGKGWMWWTNTYEPEKYEGLEGVIVVEKALMPKTGRDCGENWRAVFETEAHKAERLEKAEAERRLQQ